MTRKDIFDHIDSRPKRGRGFRLELARYLNCPVSHISQVLNGNSHFSMEHAEGINEHLGHTQEEADFFLLLLQIARAGTQPLKKRLESQIERIIEKRSILKDRLGVSATLTVADQATFYSSWLYGAVHVMLSIPKLQTKEAISRHLGISIKRSSEILEFLVSIGLATREKGHFVIGTERIHLGSDSPLISKFHTNWRMQAIRSLERENPEKDLHYSSVVTLSESDVTRIKERLIKEIAETKSIIRESKEECVHCFSLDFFRI